MPSISRNKKVVPVTKDRYQVTEDMTLYWWESCSDRIVSFNVYWWNDGKTANLHFAQSPQKKPYYVEISGCGGKGVYAMNERDAEQMSVYSMFIAKDCWANLSRLLEYRRKFYMKRIKNTPMPKEVKTRYE